MPIQNVVRINRVEKTAKLIGVPGSVADANRRAAGLNKRFYSSVKDTFDKRNQNGEESYISGQEIGEYLEKLAKGVFAVVRKSPDDNCQGSVALARKKLAPHRIWAYRIDLPFENIGDSLILGKDKLDVLSHEIRHFFDYITQPKMVASNHKFQMLNDKLAHWKFNEQNLYVEEPADVNKDELLTGLKKKINSHFDNLGTPLSERIVVLQEFRYMLKTESNAKKDQLFYSLKPNFELVKNKIKNGEGTKLYVEELGLLYDSKKFATKKQKQKALCNYENTLYGCNIKAIHDGIYFFDEKIKLLEEMIYEDISKVRATLKAESDAKKTT